MEAPQFHLAEEGTTRCRLCGTRFPLPLALYFPIGQKSVRGKAQMMMACSEVVLLRIFIRRQTNFLVTLGFHLVMFLVPVYTNQQTLSVLLRSLTYVSIYIF